MKKYIYLSIMLRFTFQTGASASAAGPEKCKVSLIKGVLILHWSAATILEEKDQHEKTYICLSKT